MQIFDTQSVDNIQIIEAWRFEWLQRVFEYMGQSVGHVSQQRPRRFQLLSSRNFTTQPAQLIVRVESRIGVVRFKSEMIWAQFSIGTQHVTKKNSSTALRSHTRTESVFSLGNSRVSWVVGSS
jgi:hypothetical protein